MAIFILGNLSDPDCVVEGRIRLGRRSHYNLDYYAPEHASVLSEWKGPLRVSRITWLGLKVGPRLREFSRQMREKWYVTAGKKFNKPGANFSGNG